MRHADFRVSKTLNSEISIGNAQNRRKKKAFPGGELTDLRSKCGWRLRDRGRRWQPQADG